MTDQTPGAIQPELETLFLMGSGGRVAKGLERFRLARAARLRVGRLAVLAALGTWLPLFVLAIIEGVAWGNGISVPFLKDFLPYGQLLVAVPVLILGEVTVGRRLGRAVAELRQSDVLSPEDTPKLDRILERAVERWRGRAVNAVIALIAAGGVALALLQANESQTGTWQYIGGRPTLSGWWYQLISLSVVRFLALRWMWRLALWAWVLWRTARLKLHPRPTHPDRAGGMAFLGGTQTAFGGLVFAVGVQLSCIVADAVIYRGADLMEFKGHLVAFVLIMLVVMLVPLLVFAPTMSRAREEHLITLSGRGYRAAAYLDRKLGAGGEGELPVDDVSGMTDFGPLYENARLMRTVPLEHRHVFSLLAAALLPFLPLVFLAMPAQEVFKTLVRLLI